MISIRSAVVSFFTGSLLVIAWVIFIDGQTQSHDRFLFKFIVAPLISTLATVMINLVSINQVNKNTAVKVWLFFWVTVSIICIGAAIYILTRDFSPTDNYAGVTILIQTVIMFFAGLLYFVGRKPCEAEYD